MKTKNPLYVVKGQTVQEAKGVFDLIVKQMNLEPVMEFVMNFLKVLLEQVKSYPMFLAVKTLIDEALAKVLPIVMKFATR